MNVSASVVQKLSVVWSVSLENQTSTFREENYREYIRAAPIFSDLYRKFREISIKHYFFADNVTGITEGNTWRKFLRPLVGIFSLLKVSFDLNIPTINVDETKVIVLHVGRESPSTALVR